MPNVVLFWPFHVDGETDNKIDVEGNEKSTLRDMLQILGQQDLHAVVFEDGLGASTGAKHPARCRIFNYSTYEVASVTITLLDKN